MALLNCGPPLQDRTGNVSALQTAAAVGHPGAIGPLIEMGAALHLAGTHTYSPFQYAVMRNDRVMVDIFFSYCKSLQDSYDRGPLMYAKSQCVLILMDSIISGC